MYYHRLIISYKGSHYFGWQDLGSDEESSYKPTIEASIHQVLSKICKYKNCTISAASRTDAGVHAQGQVLKISIPLAIESNKLQLGMNSLLPDDIRVLACVPCDTVFNPNTDSMSKEYHYHFCTHSVYIPVLHDIVAHVPTLSSIDIEHMQEACKLFVGKHDFYSFAKRDSSKHSTIRTIVSCELLHTQPSPFGNDIYTIKLVGTGFLRYMVRYIVGALFALGKKQISLNEISEALSNHNEHKLTPRAKSRGLHLIHICY